MNGLRWQLVKCETVLMERNVHNLTTSRKRTRRKFVYLIFFFTFRMIPYKKENALSKTESEIAEVAAVRKGQGRLGESVAFRKLFDCIYFENSEVPFPF